MKRGNLSVRQSANEGDILNNMNVGLTLINREMEITWLNKIMESWFGKSEISVGKKCYTCFKRSQLECEYCPVVQTFKDKKSHTRDITTGFTTVGKKKYFRITTTPVLDDQGNVEKVLRLALDITKKRKDDVKRRRRSAETRRLHREIIKLGSSFKKLAEHRSSKLKSAHEELKTIYELGNRLISTFDEKEILCSIVKIAPKLLKVSGCVVRIADETKTKLKLVAASGVSEKFQEEASQLSIGEGISGAVARTGFPIAIADLTKDNRVRYCKECARENMRSLVAVPIIFKNRLLGVLVAFSRKVKHFSKSEVNLLVTFAAHSAISLNNAILYSRIHLNYYNTITALVKAVEARDPYTYGHSERVTRYVLKIAKRLGLDRDSVELLRYAGKLHDVGKIAIPDVILRKKTGLTAAERATVETHPEKGIEMVGNLKFLKKAFPAMRHHHERYDGMGYPDRLKGNQIPFFARMLAIADSFDAMTSERPYRKSLTANKAIHEIEDNFKKQFDPQLAQLFVSIQRNNLPSRG